MSTEHNKPTPNTGVGMRTSMVSRRLRLRRVDDAVQGINKQVVSKEHPLLDYLGLCFRFDRAVLRVSLSGWVLPS